MCLSENISARTVGKRAAFLLIHCRGALSHLAHTERVMVQAFGKYLIEDGLQRRTPAQKHMTFRRLLRRIEMPHSTAVI